MADKRRRNLKCADGVADKRSRIEIVYIHITGATGDYASTINGYYELMPDTTHNDSPVYHKMTYTETWMVMLTSGKWSIQDTRDKEDNNTLGFAFSIVQSSIEKPVTDTDSCSSDLLSVSQIAISHRLD